MTDNEQDAYIKFVMNYRYRLDRWKDRLDVMHSVYVELIKDTTISKELLRKVCISNDIQQCFGFVVHRFRVECYYDSSNHAITLRWYLNKYLS